MLDDLKSLADQLLDEWHSWSASYRPHLGVPRCSPACRDSQSSKQWDTTTDINNDRVRKAEMDAVEFCVYTLPADYQKAIGIEMRNRQSSAKVWRARNSVTYSSAVDMIVPIMRKRGLFF